MEKSYISSHFHHPESAPPWAVPFASSRDPSMWRIPRFFLYQHWKYREITSIYCAKNMSFQIFPNLYFFKLIQIIDACWLSQLYIQIFSLITRCSHGASNLALNPMRLSFAAVSRDINKLDWKWGSLPKYPEVGVLSVFSELPTCFESGSLITLVDQENMFYTLEIIA